MKKTLSKREEQVLKLLLAEYTQMEIARFLGISHSRVHDVKCIIFRKWDVSGMVGLVKEAVIRGYLELENDTMTFSNPTLSSNLVSIQYTYQEEKTEPTTYYIISNN